MIVLFWLGRSGWQVGGGATRGPGAARCPLSLFERREEMGNAATILIIPLTPSTSSRAAPAVR